MNKKKTSISQQKLQFSDYDKQRNVQDEKLSNIFYEKDMSTF